MLRGTVVKKQVWYGLWMLNTATTLLQRYKSPQKMRFHDMKLNKQKGKIKSWGSGEYGVLIHYYYSQVHSDPEW